jgi:5-methylcytosine-specific restriction protein A
MFERAGMLHLNAKLDAVRGAPVKAAIEAIVTAEFRNEQDRSPVGAASGGEADAAPAADGSDSAAIGAGFEGDSGAPRRTVAQRQADALIALAEHMLGCDSGGPIDGVTVVVRMTLEDLQKGTGYATIDGVDQPVSIGAARRMASSAGVIPCVLSGESEILDWGRRRRLFSGAQKLALGERDGGCAMCGLPPGMTKVHHIRWWARDAGPTDLSNGILLCETCHHRIHDNGWDIRIDGPGVDARVWFIPPSHVDRSRTPRLGGARRYAFAAAR